MRTNAPHIFAIGDIVGQPMLAHKAVHEAHKWLGRYHSRQSLPRIGLSRAGHTGQSICTTSIRLNHSAKGSIPEVLPSGG